jgi:hypothetical protein
MLTINSSTFNAANNGSFKVISVSAGAVTVENSAGVAETNKVFLSEEVDKPTAFDDSDIVVLNNLGQPGLTVKDRFMIYLCQKYNKELLIITNNSYPVNTLFVTLVPTITSAAIYLGAENACSSVA